MSRLFEAYRAFHEQAFIPIFCRDEFDSRKQVEACAAAGCKGIEYTLRKEDAREMIPWVRKNYPDLFLVVGSTVDDEKIVRKMQRRHPQLMTVDEVADLGVDGFVSMLGWTERSITKYAPTHIVIPTAMTVTEAIMQTSWGAQFQKLAGSNIEFVKHCRQAAAFDYCPILVTGGQTPEKMPDIFEAGAVMVATGFDLSLKGKPTDVGVDDITKVVKIYVKAAQDAQDKAWPELARARGASDNVWLDALPHYHPFQED